MNETVKAIGDRALRDDLPEFAIGDTVKLQVRIREGEKERTQAFEGTVLARSGSGPTRCSRCAGSRRASASRGPSRSAPRTAVTRRDATRQGETREALLSETADRQGRQDEGQGHPVARQREGFQRRCSTAVEGR